MTTSRKQATCSSPAVLRGSWSTRTGGQRPSQRRSVARGASSSQAVGFPSRQCSPRWTPSKLTAEPSPSPQNPEQRRGTVMPGLMRGIARTAVVAGTATVVSGRVSRRQQGRWAQKDQQAQAQQEAEAPPAQAPPAQGSDMDTKLAQLKDLGQLKEQGV